MIRPAGPPMVAYCDPERRPDIPSVVERVTEQSHRIGNAREAVDRALAAGNPWAAVVHATRFAQAVAEWADAFRLLPEEGDDDGLF